MTAMDSKRVLLYFRISPKPEENRQTAAIDRQDFECREFCERRGWIVVRVFEDQGVSATSRKPRPGYEALLRAMEAGEGDVVVCWALDRLHRRPDMLEPFLEVAERKRVGLATVQGDYDTSGEDGQFMLRMMVSLAKKEMDSKSRRQRAAHDQRARDGRPWVTRRPFGYVLEREAGTTQPKLIPHPVEAPIVRRMYAEMLAGSSVYGLRQRLNAEGITTASGRPWKDHLLRPFLLNPRNAGLLVHRTGVREHKLEAWKMPVSPGNWKPLVSEETWRAVLAICSRPPTGGSAQGRKHLLSGLIECGLCGGNVGSTWAASGTLRKGETGKRPKMRAYGCRNELCSPRPRRKAEPIEDYVVETLMRRLERPDAAVLYAQQPTVTADLASEAALLRQRLVQWAEEAAAEGLTPREVAVYTKAIRTRLSEVERAMSGAVRDTTLAPLLGGNVRETWARLDLDQRRAVIQAAGMKISLLTTVSGRRPSPEQLKIEWTTNPTEAPA